MNKHLGVVEQLISSGGNFLFFLVSARYFGLDEFTNFAIIFSCVQLLHNVSLQWSLLPIVSQKKSTSNAYLISNIFLKNIVILFVSPFFWMFYLNIVNMSFDTQYIFNYTLFTCGYLLYDINKYVFVRMESAGLIILMHICKWSLILICSIFSNLQLDTIFFSSIFMVAMLFSMIKIFPYVKFDIRFNISSEEMKTGPLFIQALANNYQTIVFNSIFNQVSSGMFGAFIAFKSLTNIAPVIIQYLETHAALSALNKGNETLLNNKKWTVFVLMSILLIVLVAIYHSIIVKHIFGKDYMSFSFVLPLVLLVVMVQSANRLMSVDLRMQNNTRVFHFSALSILIMSTLAGVVFYNGGSVESLFLIFVFLPIVQSIIIFRTRFKNASSRVRFKER